MEKDNQLMDGMDKMFYFILCTLCNLFMINFIRMLSTSHAIQSGSLGLWLK